MYGLAFEVFEAWVLDEHGLDTWHGTKKKAKCNVEDKGFVSRTTYEYKLFVKLVKSLSLYIEMSADKILRNFGSYVVGYLFASEYGSILRSQGATMQEWLSNINTSIDHFQRSFPRADGQSNPVFWSEDHHEEKGTILLHHYNPRGNVFVSMVVGFIDELASYHFELDIKMELINLQNSGDSKYSSWMIKAADPEHSWKITPSVPRETSTMNRLLGLTESDLPKVTCPFVENAEATSVTTHPTTEPIANIGSKEALTVDRMRQLFPFHVIVDQDFSVVQVGCKLPLILKTSQSELCGAHMKQLFQVIRPQMAFDWDWNVLERLWNHTFLLKPATEALKATQQDTDVLLAASLLTLSTRLVMFSLRPRVMEIDTLKRRGVTLSDMSNVTSERDAMLLGEYVSREAGKTFALEKLSKDLRAEKKLSDTLLHNMLPKNVATDLRNGKTVEPKYHENVTLFFSDVEGFTSLCDQIQPWDVIDMMNQLYSVMDFLAKHFELYKVETVGDAYICAAGLPESAEDHAEKIANFALAVLECTKHVKSPLTGEPVQLRIGIHTGSCTAGVVGTLTPHYCLFGDMVNFTARHETSGSPGKIHCSNELFEHLKSRAPAGAQQYRFKPRGLVDMKGKGEHLTHWLERGTENNHFANPGSLLTLSNKVRKRISSKKWKMRKYFQSQKPSTKSVRSLDASTRSTDLSCMGSVTSGGTGSVTINSGLSFNEEMEVKKVEAQHEAILNYSDELSKHAQKWRELHFDSFLPDDEMVSEIFSILFSTLNKCIQKGGRRLKVIKDQLRTYVQAIVDLYNTETLYHSLRNAAEIMQRAAFLMERRSEVAKKDPWDVFMMVFAIFVRDIHHLDISDDQIEHERHYLVSHYRGKGAYQQRGSLDAALEILEDDFQQLYEEIFLGCPTFRRGVKKLVVASADIEVESKFQSMLSRFDSLFNKPSARVRAAQHESDDVLALLLALATMGHYCQSYDLFLHWDQLQLMSQLHLFENDKRPTDPCKGWHREQTSSFKDVVQPLVTRVETLLPKNSTWLRLACINNLTLWERDGREWVSASLIPQAKVTAAPWAYNSDMISSNLAILEILTAEVAVNRGEDGTVGEVDWESLKKTRTPYEEMRLSLDVNKGDNRVRIESSSYADLPVRVQEELRDFMLAIANAHGRNEFHNFHRASHSAHIADLLIQSLEKAADEDRKVSFDPLVRFAVVLSALVHDVGHSGVPNDRLKVEKPELADVYSNKSIAEQHAIDMTWRIFMSDDFMNLREFMFGSSVAECKRLRDLMVNGIMATDMANPVLKALRKRRWRKAATCTNTKATLILEHILQVSSVSHFVQTWDLYLEWNERQFWEAYLAFIEERSSKDPSETWYKEQLKFFDDVILPLTETGTEAGVWDILSDQLFQQATMNRLKWELEGKTFCESLVQKTKARFSKPSDATATTAAESMLTSTIVEQIESLSKVIKRYEKKAETACGNLITVAYNDHSSQATKGLRNQPWSEIHQHFRQQGWYRVHSKTLAEDDPEPVVDSRPVKDVVIHDC